MRRLLDVRSLKRTGSGYLHCAAMLSPSPVGCAIDISVPIFLIVSDFQPSHEENICDNGNTQCDISSNSSDSSSENYLEKMAQSSST